MHFYQFTESVEMFNRYRLVLLNRSYIGLEIFVQKRLYLLIFKRNDVFNLALIRASFRCVRIRAVFAELRIASTTSSVITASVITPSVVTASVVPATISSTATLAAALIPVLVILTAALAPVSAASATAAEIGLLLLFSLVSYLLLLTKLSLELLA
jgi:hypothetical protein